MGVGASVDDHELNGIADDPSKVMKVTDFSDLAALVPTLANLTCPDRELSTIIRRSFEIFV